MAAPVLADPRPRARALRGRAAPRRRHDAVRAPGRRALGHADRAHLRGAGRRATRPPPRRRRAEEELPSGEVEIEGDELPDEEPLDWDEAEEAEEEVASEAALDDPGAARRFWFEHATGAGKTVAARRLRRGLAHRRRPDPHPPPQPRRPVPRRAARRAATRTASRRRCSSNGNEPPAGGPVTVETYQWFVRNAGKISDAYTVVICDEAHTALGEKTSAAIRQWIGPVFIGMTATGALIARHVTDLFPTQTSRFDLAQAARRGVIAPLRCVRIPPGVGVRSIANVPLRKGEVDQDFDQEELAALLDQTPFNLAIADLYKTRFKDLPGVVYSAGVKHAHNVAKAFIDAGMKAKAVSGETPKRELTRILAAYERGEIDVLVNAQLLAEGWNSPRATVCMHLAPTASKRIYQQRVGRVTRRTPGKEAGIVVDFVHPATTNDDPVVTLHSLLDRDVYRGGAIVVGPVRRGRGRRLRVERRVVPVTADEERRAQVFERELWRMAVEHLTWGQQQAWAMLAGARVASNNWRRAKAMLHFDSTGELRRLFLLTCLKRNRNTQLRLRALGEVGALRDPRRSTRPSRSSAAGRATSAARASKCCCRRWPSGRSAAATRPRAGSGTWPSTAREVHEEYAVQRWPETKRLLGLLVNSSGQAHARNARRLVQAARKHDRRLSARAAGRRAGAHARGAAGARRRAHADGAQALRAGARAAAQLPQGQAPPRRPPPAQEGRRRASRRRRGGAGQRKDGAAATTTVVDDDDRGTTTTTPRTTHGRRPTGRRPASTMAAGSDDDDADDDGRRRRRATAALRATRATAGGRRAGRRGAAPRVSAAGGPRRRRASTWPAAVSTSSAPLSSMPAAGALAVVPADRLARAARRARARRRAPSRGRRGEPAVEGVAAARRARASAVVSTPASRSDVAVSASSSRERLGRHVEADAEHRPARLRPPLDEDARRACGRSTQTSFGHLIAHCDRRAPRRSRPRRPAAAARRSRARPATSAAPTAAARSSRGPAARGRRSARRRSRASRAARPSSASSFARSLVESVTRWWTRGCRGGRSSRLAAGPRRRARSRAWRRRRRG